MELIQLLKNLKKRLRENFKEKKRINIILKKEIKEGGILIKVLEENQIEKTKNEADTLINRKYRIWQTLIIFSLFHQCQT